MSKELNLDWIKALFVEISMETLLAERALKPSLAVQKIRSSAYDRTRLIKHWFDDYHAELLAEVKKLREYRRTNEAKSMRIVEVPTCLACNERIDEDRGHCTICNPSDDEE